MKNVAPSLKTNRKIARTLASNLLLARTVCDLTQPELALRAGVSRATIAQIESGEGDPRLETISNLAMALGTNPVMLLMGPAEFKSIISVIKNRKEYLKVYDHIKEDVLKVNADSKEYNRRLHKDIAVTARMAGSFVNATKINAEDDAKDDLDISISGIARASTGAAIGSAIGMLVLPGIGSIIGGALGAYIAREK